MCKQSWLWTGCLSLSVCICTHTHSAGMSVSSVPGVKHSLTLCCWAELKVNVLCRPILSFNTVLDDCEEEPRGIVHSKPLGQHLQAVLRAVRWGLLIRMVVRRRVTRRDHCGPQVAGSRLGVIWQAWGVGKHVGALQERPNMDQDEMLTSYWIYLVNNFTSKLCSTETQRT